MSALSHSEALTCDQNHDYTPEQKAFNNGKMDKFVQNTSVDTCTGQPILFGAPGLAMDYYDGNTTTALWNYAQNYAMSDNNYGTNFGPSTPGALNVIAGNDGGGFDPAHDDCSNASHTSDNPVGFMTGRNIGNLLNARHITWGWFQGGFAPTGTSTAGFKECNSSSNNIGGISAANYSPHHNPFEYFASTANQASVVTFIENNWLGGQRIGDGSADATSGSLSAANGVLDFNVKPHFTPLFLTPVTGNVVGQH